MALLSANCLTLLDWAKRVDPDGRIAQIVELMSQTNEILDDMMVMEGNLPTGHRTTVRTGLPNVVWRQLYQGVQPSKSITAQVEDTCGLAVARSEIDVELANMNGNDPDFMMSEQLPFIETMNQTMAGGMFYFDTALNPERFLGLSPRYGALATKNVINGGQSGSTASMWLISWGPNTVHAIFPKGSKAGLEQEYKGIEKCFDTQTPPGSYYAHVNVWTWRLGLCVRDWRYIVRYCNINPAIDATSNQVLIDSMVDMMAQLPTLRTIQGRPAFYCNKVIWAQLTKAALDKTNLALTWDNVFGKPVLQFWGIPIRQVDQLLLAETALT